MENHRERILCESQELVWRKWAVAEHRRRGCHGSKIRSRRFVNQSQNLHRMQRKRSPTEGLLREPLLARSFDLCAQLGTTQLPAAQEFRRELDELLTQNAYFRNIPPVIAHNSTEHLGACNNKHPHFRHPQTKSPTKCKLHGSFAHPNRPKPTRAIKIYPNDRISISGTRSQTTKFRKNPAKSELRKLATYGKQKRKEPRKR